MKAKILAQLKAKFTGVQAALLDRVADALASTVTKEEDIETAVGNSAGLVTAFAGFLQSETDRRVTEAITKKQTEHDAEIAKLTKGGDDDKGKDKDKGNDTPAWAKDLLEKVARLESTHVAKSHNEKLTAKLKEAGIPEKFYKVAISGRTFKDDTEVEALATEITTNFTEYEQELADQGLAVHPKPTNQRNSNIEDKVPANVETYIAEKFDDKGAKDLGGKKI
jgi:hypothetical protein